MPDLMPLFGLLIIDREPLVLADLPGLVQVWLMDAGVYAFGGLALYILYVFLGRRTSNVAADEASAERKAAGRIDAITSAAVRGSVGGVARHAASATASAIARGSSERQQQFPITPFMLICFALALIGYAVYWMLALGNIGVDLKALEKLQKYDPTGYNKTTATELSWAWQPVALAVAGLFAVLGFGAPFAGYLWNLVRRADASGRAPKGTPGFAQSVALMLAAWAVIGVAAWFALGAVPAAREWIGVGVVAAVLLSAGWAAYRCRVWDRFGPVYAIAKLTVLEVFRTRVFLALLLPLVIVLFPLNWFLKVKPEDELRLVIGVSTLLTQVVLLLICGALAAFAIPNDVKNQNLYTVVTKPVQPFDVVLGRFLGFVALATAALIVMTGGGWLLIEASTVSAKAKEETFKARVPLRGKLNYESRKGDIEGTDVGREFNYRKYIAGHPSSSQRAVWRFARLPSSLPAASGQAVPLEFTFDIYRLTKGVENQGVIVNVRVVSWRCPQEPPRVQNDGVWKWADRQAGAGGKTPEQRYEEVARAKLIALPGGRYNDASIGDPKVILANAKPGTEEWAVANEVAGEFGFYEIVGKEVFDYHPTTLLVPAALFANALATAGPDGKPLPKPTGPDGKELATQVAVYVKCESSSQMLGMAEGDLYLMEAEQSFGQNYFKAAVGLWCRLVILIGLAVVCSTYLVGVVSFLAAAFLFVAGYAGQYVTELALGRSTSGGGPVKAFSQLAQAKLPTAPDETTAGVKAAAYADEGFAWIIRRVVNLFPDVESYDWTPFLAEGFNVSFVNLAMNLIVMVGYLLPWLVLGFYLIRGREVAA